MLQNSFNITESSNNVHAVTAQLPEFTITSLRRPPEWIADNHTISHNGIEKEATNTHTVSAVDIASDLFVLASHGRMPDC